ncbi:MAG: competence protein ComEA [Frankiales bacterium]|nr:competence protein ComEA [Frankiales bacterium]
MRRLLPRLPAPAAGWVPLQPSADEPSTESQSVRAALAEARVDPARHGVAALAVVALLAAALAGFLLLRGRPSEQPVSAPPVIGASATSGPELVVDVAGRVRHPGLVRLRPGARVDDALRAAGGVLPGTSTGTLNLAAKVEDGQQVLVGLAGPAPQTGGAPALLDLNTATAQDLDALPGIGPVLADRIVSWRTEHGRFGSVDQLREVSGIGESKYQSLKAKVRV